MISTILRQAQAYEKENMTKVPRKERPCYHVTGPVGWINDPNGFSEYDVMLLSAIATRTVSERHSSMRALTA